MKIRIKFLEDFKDGNILPQAFRNGDTVVVEKWQAEQIIRSGGQVEVLERLIPLQKHIEEVTPVVPDEPPALVEEVAPVVEPTPAPILPAAKRTASRKKK